MTVTAQGLSQQGLTGPGIGSSPGSFGSAFPAPMGLEQFSAIPQAFGSQVPGWPQPGFTSQVPYGTPSPYGQSQWASGQTGYGGPSPFGFAQPGAGLVQSQQVPQLIGHLVAQILPVAKQMILPQVIAMTAQVVPQLIAQLGAPQHIGQLLWNQQGTAPFASGSRPYAGQF